MGYSYPVKGAGYFLSKMHKKLCFNDLIWVVEGSGEFSLVDCFEYKDNRHPPFPGMVSDFEVKIIGETSLLDLPVVLSKTKPWFKELHANYITKQKFFSAFENSSLIARGLKESLSL